MDTLPKNVSGFYWNVGSTGLSDPKALRVSLMTKKWLQCIDCPNKKEANVLTLRVLSSLSQNSTVPLIQLSIKVLVGMSLYKSLTSCTCWAFSNSTNNLRTSIRPRFVTEALKILLIARNHYYKSTVTEIAIHSETLLHPHFSDERGARH